MKRCPLCDFIYEDEQRRCDMDGIELVYDSRPPPSNPVTSRRRRGRKQLTIGTISVAISLFAGVYVVRHRGLSEPRKSPISVTTESLVRPSDALPPPASPPSPEAAEGRTTAAIAEASPSRRSGTQPARSESATRNREESKARAATAGARKGNDVGENPRAGKDSKVGSFLKKTGRILKKPFKF
jgi:hypothetical protein